MASAVGLPPLSVIIVTWRRPEFVRQCLERLGALEGPAPEVIVVDGSEDAATQDVVAHFPGVKYSSFRGGAGHLTRARNAGLPLASGGIVAFLDDDAWVRPGWAKALVEAYDDPGVVAAVGRTVNQPPGDELADPARIGCLEPDGRLTANFAADPGTVVAVDHGIGANMSFRRDVLAELGGFRDDFRGVGGTREDTDIFFRVRALGHRAVFVPGAVVDHVAAPHARGKRFDWRYIFWLRRNHVLLLSRNYGLTSSITVRWLLTELFSGYTFVDNASYPRRVVRSALKVGAIILGIAESLWKAGLGPQDPRRRGSSGDEIARALAQNRGKTSPAQTSSTRPTSF